MSGRPKNNHYHYAEKYDRMNRRRKSGRNVYLPFKALIASLVVLMMFGFVSTTFGAYITETEPEPGSENNQILSEVRNVKSSRDVVVTGANADLAETGITVTGGTKYFLFDASSTSWTNVQLFVGKGTSGNSSWTTVYNMTNISNTKLYFMSFDAWTDATYIRFVTGCSDWGDGQWGSSNIPSAGNYTGAYTGTFTFNGGSVYCWAPASTLSSPPVPTYSSNGYAYYNLDQTAYAYYKSGTGNYAKGTTGGTVSVDTGYVLNGNDSSTNATASNSSGTYTITAAKTSTLTLKATAAANYRFVGWFTSTTATTPTSTNTTISYTVTKANTQVYYARFIRTYNVSITKYPTAYTGTAPSFTYNGSNYTSSTAVDVGSSITLNSNNTTSGITCTFRSGNATSGTVITSPCTITTGTTIYACYSLSAPTISSFTYSGSPTVEGAAAITPTRSATSAAGTSGSLTYSYSYVANSGPATPTLNTSTGAFSASVAGKYTIRLTVTDTVKGLTANATKDFEITVKPVAPTGIEYEALGIMTGAGSYDEPYKVANNTNGFSIHSWIPLAQRNANYTYTWTRTDGTYLISNGTITNGSNSKTADGTEVTDDTLAATLAAANPVLHNTTLDDASGYIYKIAVKSKRNNVESDPYYFTFYYGVTADFLRVESFDFKSFNSDTPKQKIYAEDNTIDHIDATYEAGGSAFHTMLWFAKDNINFNKVAVWTPSSFTISSGTFAGTHSALPNDAAHQISTLVTSIATEARNSVNLMSTTGPKWFKGFVDDYQNSRVAAVYPELHTTVGASSASGNRPVYFYDNTGKTYMNSRVMAFYVVDGDNTVRYQTGQKIVDSEGTVVSNRTTTYRFYVPSNATKVSFAYVADNNYVLPTYSNNTFSYNTYTDHTVLMGWTQTVDLSDSANDNKTTYNATNATADANGIYNITGSMTTLS